MLNDFYQDRIKTNFLNLVQSHLMLSLADLGFHLPLYLLFHIRIMYFLFFWSSFYIFYIK